MLRRVAAPELRQMRFFGGDVRTERRPASGTRFDALSSNNLKRKRVRLYREDEPQSKIG